MTGQAPAALVAEELTCERGGRVLFEGLGLAVAAGGALVLRGPNGSGKSSLLRILAGLLQPRAGRVLWQGVDTVEEPGSWRRALAVLGHDNAIKPQLSVAQNIGFWAAMAPGACDPADATIAALASLGLDHLADLPALMLSAGQRRRLALARLALRPGGCWLMDEPTVTLDDASLARLSTLIARHRGAGGVAVVATHEALELPDAATLELGEP